MLDIADLAKDRQTKTVLLILGVAVTSAILYNHITQIKLNKLRIKAHEEAAKDDNVK